MSHKPWMDRPEYQHVESNPDPNFRPGLGKLVHKIRHLKLLQDRPDSVEFLLNDVEYWFLYREKLRPQALWRMMVRSKARWEMAIREITANTKDYPITDEQLDAYMVLAHKAWDEPPANYEDIRAAIAQLLEITQKVPTGDVSSERVSLPSVPVVGSAGLDGGAPDELFKSRIQGVLKEHSPNLKKGEYVCGCSKKFKGTNGWSKHVMKRIVRTLGS